MNISLPNKDNVPVTSEEDPALLYYKPFVSSFYLKRMALAIGLIDKGPKENFLDIGYGSGIFLPELGRYSKRVFGLDNHSNAFLVKEMLNKEGRLAYLTSADVSAMPYKENVFDCVICLSVLEHVDNLDSCISEIIRITRPGGQVIIGIPVDNFLMSLGFKLLGYNIRNIHKWKHRHIIDAIQKKIEIETLRKLPSFVNLDFALYIVVSCRKL
ncbi:MAG: class I SAM-dependent methyltransferase [Candidatus Omnitrophica bacterium]|nr:class I SAM-dependent methyltransferase [Candidatus Omnitrophota bacterium]